MSINRHLFWGFNLWLIGYVLGFIFFALVPPALIGWYIMPIGIAITVLALWKWVKPVSLQDAVILGLAWAAIAILCDWLFIVKLLAPSDGYYKPDIWLYYALTLALPALVWYARRQRG